MTSRESLLVAVRIFGIYLLVQAAMAIPSLISGVVMYFTVLDPTSDGMSSYLRSVYLGALAGLLSLVIFPIAGIWLLRKPESLLRLFGGEMSGSE
jgi:hypothetical protein